ncbi:MAG: hypothetical protein IJ860_09830 [Eubacterium sp.]|nr:hypothetical protein [Eubacterium sp.]
MGDNKGKVMSVLGSIEPEQLGRTLMHEHLYFDLTAYRSEHETPEQTAFFYEPMTLKNLHRIANDPYSNRDNCINMDRELTLREMSYFKIAGGQTIVDVTPGGVHEGVMAAYMPMLVDLSKSSGIQVVAGFGHYLASSKTGGESPITMGVRDPALAEMTDDQVADLYIRAVEDGFGDTGVRPGIIGELGTGSIIEASEAKVLRAAGAAQKETGLAITLHMHLPARNGHEALDLISSNGGNPERVVMGHSDSLLCQTGRTYEQGIDYLLSLLERGAYIEFDLCGNSSYFRTDEAHWWLPSDRERAKGIHELCRHGFADKILLSHDTGHKYYLREYGGWGWAHVLTEFRRTMLEEGIDEKTIEGFSVSNPQSVLTIV